MAELNIAHERHGITIGSWPDGMPPDGKYYRDTAQHIERLGYDMIFCGDHIFHNAPLLECLTTLSHLAAVTERVKIGSSVVLVPLRDPSIVAKEFATIDFLSGGRTIFGAGIGGEFEAEWNAVGVDRSTRGRRMDEYLNIIKHLWSGEPVTFDGTYRQIPNVTLAPPPAQPGGPPVWIGGRSDAALRRASRFDGWVSYVSSPRRVRESVEKIREFSGGNLPDGFRIAMSLFFLIADTKEDAIIRGAKRLQGGYDQDFTQILESIGAVGTADHVSARLEAYREAGVQDFLWAPMAGAAEFREQTERLAKLVGIGSLRNS